MSSVAPIKNVAPMYRLPRLVTVPQELDLPDCMYKMESLNKVSNLNTAESYYGGGVKDPCVPGNAARRITGKLNDVASLELRQMAVLQRLQELKQQLDKLQGSKSLPETGVGAAAQSSPLKTGVVHDLVISANPQKPPYSLVLLRKLLKEAGYPVYSVNHVHSSVLKVNNGLQSCFTDQPLGERNKHKVAFTLHWKEVASLSLMVSPLRQSHVCGEANVMRYISRLFPLTSPYNYEAAGPFTSITEVDTLLDQLDNQLANGNNREKQAVLRQLNSRLGKASWLTGESCNIGDVLAWSLLKQADLIATCPANVKKWYKVVSDMAGLDSQAEVSEPNPAAKQSQKPRAQNTSSQKPKAATTEVSPQNNENKNHIDRAGFEDYLKQSNIPYQVNDHVEVFTVDAMMKYVAHMPGLHMKNLFLKDKKKNLYLLSARHDAEVKLSDIGKQIGVKDLRFGDESVMFDVLGVKQGCVTAYALLNDKEHKVKFLLDSEALNETHPFVNFHPMSNAATLGISPSNFQKFLKSSGHEPTLLTLK